MLLLFWVLIFWPRGMWELSSPTRDGTSTPCIGKQNLNHWTSREVPPRTILFRLIFSSWNLEIVAASRAGMRSKAGRGLLWMWSQFPSWWHFTNLQGPVSGRMWPVTKCADHIWMCPVSLILLCVCLYVVCVWCVSVYAVCIIWNPIPTPQRWPRSSLELTVPHCNHCLHTPPDP